MSLAVLKYSPFSKSQEMVEMIPEIYRSAKYFHSDNSNTALGVAKIMKIPAAGCLCHRLNLMVQFLLGTVRSSLGSLFNTNTVSQFEVDFEDEECFVEEGMISNQNNLNHLLLKTFFKNDCDLVIFFKKPLHFAALSELKKKKDVLQPKLGCSTR